MGRQKRWYMANEGCFLELSTVVRFIKVKWEERLGHVKASSRDHITSIKLVSTQRSDRQATRLYLQASLR